MQEFVMRIFSFIPNWWNARSYAIKGAVMRGIRVGIGTTMGVLVVAYAGPSIFQISGDLGPEQILSIAFAVVLLAGDKWLREHNLEGSMPKTVAQTGPGK